MQQNIALKIILLVSIVGILFSGYLSFNELAKKTCPAGGCSSLLGISVCVYGLTMYIIIFVVSLLGLTMKK
jgi:uncharacterized membrane protein